jgi:hypothetical protein
VDDPLDLEAPRHLEGEWAVISFFNREASKGPDIGPAIIHQENPTLEHDGALWIVDTPVVPE